MLKCVVEKWNILLYLTSHFDSIRIGGMHVPIESELLKLPLKNIYIYASRKGYWLLTRYTKWGGRKSGNLCICSSDTYLKQIKTKHISIQMKNLLLMASLKWKNMHIICGEMQISQAHFPILTQNKE